MGIALQIKLFIEIFFGGIGILLEAWGGIGLKLFLYKLIVDLHMRPGTYILSTDRNSVYIFLMTSEKLGISQIKDSKFTPLFLKFKTSVHSQIAISRYCILITNFLTWQRYSEPCQTSKTEFFAEKVNVWRLLVIFAKSSILDVSHGSEYTSA